MFVHECHHRVRYAETDQMGFSYYGNYAMYYETGRVEALRSLGLSYRELEEVHGVMMPVLEMNVRYLLPARYDELIRIRTIIRQWPQVRVAFEFEIYGENGALINQGSTLLAFVRRDNLRPCRVPAHVSAAFAPYFTEEEGAPAKKNS